MIEKINLDNEGLENLSREDLISIIGQLRDSIKAQEDFLLNISHDLRNPINVILSILQCIKYLDDNENKGQAMIKQEEYRGLIKRNTLKMVKLIDNLIDTTKLEGNYYKINKKNIDIVNIVENIVTSIENYADEKDIQLVFDTNVEECIIGVDPDCIDRIVLNLLSNSIKFSPNGGIVSVYVYVDEDKISISVKDEGPGIPKEEQAAIFNRFVQSSNNKKGEQSGSGIGLDLVNYLTKLHGGSIELNSEFGYGSEFIVSLPKQIVEDEVFSGEMPVSNNKIEQLEIEFSDIYL